MHIILSRIMLYHIHIALTIYIYKCILIYIHITLLNWNWCQRRKWKLDSLNLKLPLCLSKSQNQTTDLALFEGSVCSYLQYWCNSMNGFCWPTYQYLPIISNYVNPLGMSYLIHTINHQPSTINIAMAQGSQASVSKVWQRLPYAAWAQP